MDTKIKQIRKAVCANRGGFDKATDDEVMTIWRALDPDTQKQYMDSIKMKESKDAVSSGSPGTVSDSTSK